MRGVHRIACVEQAPSQERYAEHAEVTGTDGRVSRVAGAGLVMEHPLQLSHVARKRLSGVHQKVGPIGMEAGERKVTGAADVLDAGNGTKPGEQLVQELHAARLGAVLVGGG